MLISGSIQLNHIFLLIIAIAVSKAQFVFNDKNYIYVATSNCSNAGTDGIIRIVAEYKDFTVWRTFTQELDQWFVNDMERGTIYYQKVRGITNGSASNVLFSRSVWAGLIPFS